MHHIDGIGSLEPTPSGTPISWLRRAVACGAMLATVPYLTLKLNWILGGTVGMADPAFFNNQTYFYANIVTLGMDAAAVFMAGAFTSHWGTRIPALLIVLPAWLATGFLLPTVALLPLVGATASWPAQSGDSLESWVYLLVYGGFAVQGVLLPGAFALYAKARWWRTIEQLQIPRLVVLPAKEISLLGVVTSMAAGTAGIFHMLWAFGDTIGMREPFVVAQTNADHLSHGVYGVFAFGAAVGLLMLFRRIRRGVGLVWPLVFVWAGTGAMAAWGTWLLVTGTANATTAPGYFAVSLLQVAAASAAVLVTTWLVLKRLSYLGR